MMALKQRINAAADHRGRRQGAAGPRVKDVQRDPIKPVIEHVDLVNVKKGEKVNVDVPGAASRARPRPRPSYR